MALLVVGSIGDLEFHAVKAETGYHVPRVAMKEIDVPGMLGDAMVWDSYKAPISVIRTETFTIKDASADEVEGAALSYCGTRQEFTANTAASTLAVYWAKVVSANVQHFPCFNSEDATADTTTVITWQLKLYRKVG